MLGILVEVELLLVELLVERPVEQLEEHQVARLVEREVEVRMGKHLSINIKLTILR